MPAIIQPTDIYCTLKQVLPLNSGAVGVGFSLAVPTDGEPEEIAELLVFQPQAPASLDVIAYEAHETLAQALEIAANILRREAGRYRGS